MKAVSYCFILNPRAGVKRLAFEAAIRSRMTREDVAWRVVFTERAGHAPELALRAIEDGYRRVVAVGGDGTLHETAAALIGKDAALGILPAGSGNGYAGYLGMPLQPEAAVDALLRCEPRPVDVGMATVGAAAPVPFLSNAGMGLDAVVIRNYTRDYADRRGLRSYIDASVRSFFKYDPPALEIRAAGERLFERPMLASICLCGEWGNGFRVAPGALLDDGAFDLTVVPKTGPVTALRLAAATLWGDLYRSKAVRHLRADTVEIRREGRYPYQLDGEAYEGEGTFTARVLPKALNLLAPPACPWLTNNRPT